MSKHRGSVGEARASGLRSGRGRRHPMEGRVCNLGHSGP